MLPSTREMAENASALSLHGAKESSLPTKCLRITGTMRKARGRPQHLSCQATVSTAEEPQRKCISLVNLGCPKNTVDVSFSPLTLSFSLVLVRIIETRNSLALLCNALLTRMKTGMVFGRSEE